MKRGQILVRAILKNGEEGIIDVFDLDDLSFKAYVLEGLYRAGVCGIPEDKIIGNEIKLRERE